MTTIASLTSNDYDEWLVLWNGYLAFYKTRLNEKVTAATFERITSPEGILHGAIARDDSGRAVGIVHWLTHAGTWTTTTLCYLEDLFVAPGARSGGVGRRLIAHVEDWARKAGCEKVYWITAESNSTARTLYDRVANFTGMVQYEIALGRTLRCLNNDVSLLWSLGDSNS